MYEGDLCEVLDSGARELRQMLAGALLAVAMALLVAIALPLLLFQSLFSPVSPTAPAQPTPVVVLPVGPVQPIVVEVARRYLGVPYVFGGTDPSVGLDCSGLVQLVFRQLGINLPRTAQQQFDATARVGTDQLQPGDLVFFARTYADQHDWITHVGIYTDRGMQINAPTNRHVVSIQPVFSGFWGAHYAGAGRVRRP
jgi:cell wall-associated NlpC family hydrolase